MGWEGGVDVIEKRGEGLEEGGNGGDGQQEKGREER